MRTWGWAQGLQDQDVLKAVQTHMLHESGEVRFGIGCNGQQKVTIRVMPKRGACRQAPQNCLEWQPRPTPLALEDRNHRHRKGNMSARPRPPAQQDLQTELTTLGKLSMSLDDIVRTDQTFDAGMQTATLSRSSPHRSVPWIAKPKAKPQQSARAANLQRAMEQMGWTPDTKHIRKAPQYGPDVGSAGSAGSAGSIGSVGSVGVQNQHAAGVKVQRYLAWVLRRGHQELALPVQRGWASLDVLAEAICVHRPDFGYMDGDKLLALLEESDIEGRFEVSGRLLRKLPKGVRRPWAGARSISSRGLAPSPARESSVSSRRGGRRSRSPRSSSDADDQADNQADNQDLALAEECRKSMNLNEVSSCRRAAPNDGPGPPRPPGLSWTKYRDEKCFWWFYDGPAGQWWCADEKSDPIPYVEDEED